MPIRSFREIRFMEGLASPELVRQSYELLTFLADRVPHDDLERFLTVARRYIRDNEDETIAR
jgi:hypothetical protein